MTFRYPRSLVMLDSIILLSFSLVLVFDLVDGAFDALRSPLISILVYGLLIFPALLSLSLEWFERKVQHTFAIFLVTLISIVLLSVLMYVTGNDLLFFWLVSLIILTFFPAHSFQVIPWN